MVEGTPSCCERGTENGGGEGWRREERRKGERMDK